MANNLFVSFDVNDASREAPLILSAIEELGDSVRIFNNVWYVRSSLTAAEAARRVWDVMEPADQLLVVDASSDEAATFNLFEGSLRSMVKRWHLDVKLPDDVTVSVTCTPPAVTVVAAAATTAQRR